MPKFHLYRRHANSSPSEGSASPYPDRRRQRLQRHLPVENLQKTGLRIWSQRPRERRISQISVQHDDPLASMRDQLGQI